MTDLKVIKELDFIECPIFNMQNYREKIYEMFPSLEILDSIDKDGIVVDNDEDDDDDENDDNNIENEDEY